MQKKGKGKDAAAGDDDGDDDDVDDANDDDKEEEEKCHNTERKLSLRPTSFHAFWTSSVFGPFNLYTTLSRKDPPFKEDETEVWAGETTCYHH